MYVAPSCWVQGEDSSPRLVGAGMHTKIAIAGVPGGGGGDATSLLLVGVHCSYHT